MKQIRVWGIIVFFVLLALAALLFYWVAPGLVKSSIEGVGSEALGAKVEVEQVNLSLFPFGVEIQQLQATNPDLPMENIVEVDKIAFALDSKALLWKKVLIDELNFSGVKLGTTRTKSGALKTSDADNKLLGTKQEADPFSIDEIKEKDIKKMVDNADLVTLKRLNKLNKDYTDMEKYWDKTLDPIKNKARIETLKIEFQRLSKRAKKNKMNLIIDRKDWKKFKKDINKEKKNLKQMEQRLTEDKKSLRAQVLGVKNGPNDDLEAIMSKVGLGNGVTGLTDKYLGKEFTSWIENIIKLAHKMGNQQNNEEEVQQDYSTKKGNRVVFKDSQTFPDVLVKKLIINGEDDSLKFSGLGHHLGYFPWLIGKPMKLKLDVKGDGEAKLVVNSDWESSEKMSTDIESKVSHWNVKNMNLMQTEQGQWRINSGTLNASLKGNINLKKVNLALSIKIKDPSISEPKALAGWQKVLATSLKGQKFIDLKVKATGSLSSLKLKMTSSIDKLFTQAIGTELKSKANKLKGKFSNAISSRIGDLSSINNTASGLDKFSEKLSGYDDLLDELKKGSL